MQADGWIVEKISLLSNPNQVRPKRFWGVYTKLKVFNMTKYKKGNSICQLLNFNLDTQDERDMTNNQFVLSVFQIHLSELLAFFSMKGHLFISSYI